MAFRFDTRAALEAARNESDERRTVPISPIPPIPERVSEETSGPKSRADVPTLPIPPIPEGSTERGIGRIGTIGTATTHQDPPETSGNEAGIGRIGRIGTGSGSGREIDAAAAIDHFEERAAIREHDGGQPREVAEAAALLEAAQAAGVEPDDLRALLRKVNVASG